MVQAFRGDYNYLSNFWLVDVEYNGVVYPSVEHAYMSAKSDDPQWKSYCANRNISPSDVKKNSTHVRLVNNWNRLKLVVMEECLRSKFNKEPYRSKLLTTDNENIQEGNVWNDVFWGVDLTVNPNKGENHLGRLIMKIREELQIKTQ
jgi:ribA/ribD-fused uncharacterized protein